MKITYIGHSGFCVDTGGALLLFDYYTDAAGVLGKLLDTEKPVYVFASHAHGDHFNRDIFSWRKKLPQVSYILSDDISANGDDCVQLHLGDTISPAPGMRVTAYDSTDQGVSFLVETREETIFHAGDLNWWHWRAESSPAEIAKADRWFFDAVKPLENARMDIAFFPVDPRMGAGYDDGAVYFCEKVRPRVFIPMHFWNHPEAALRFRDERSFPDTRIAALTKPGESIEL